MCLCEPTDDLPDDLDEIFAALESENENLVVDHDIAYQVLNLSCNKS